MKAKSNASSTYSHTPNLPLGHFGVFTSIIEVSCFPTPIRGILWHLLSKDQIGVFENSTPSRQRSRSKMPQERLTSKYLKFTPPNWMENYDWLIGYATWTRSYMTRIFQYTNMSGVPCCNQRLFLVPLIGGRWYIMTQVAVYTTYIIYHLYIANWVTICYLPPIKGTRNNQWLQRHESSSVRPYIISLSGKLSSSIFLRLMTR